MTTINILDMQTANLIAAGEVVDRPSSAVKELLENSIDAGATRVTVEIRNGGKTLMRVTDNGRGMSREDAVICVRRHATSKIRDKSDLDGISTLGFRGEALAAISAVSDMRILTREPGSDFGSLITVKAGEVISAEDAGGPAGTTVIAENLFAQVPARRKFLRRDAAETASVSAVVEKVALSRPDISFKYIADGTVKFMTSGDGKLGSAIAAVLGGGFASKLIPVDGEYDGIRTRGYVGTPENVRATRSAENFFVNGRYVRCLTAGAALEQAFSSYIPKDRFPVAVLRIDFSPSLVDVNVHPQKLEVRFSDERPVYSSVFETVRDALRRKVPIQSFSSFFEKKDQELLSADATPYGHDYKASGNSSQSSYGGRPSGLRDDEQLNGYAATNDSDSKLQSTYRAPFSDGQPSGDSPDEKKAGGPDRFFIRASSPAEAARLAEELERKGRGYEQIPIGSVPREQPDFSTPAVENGGKKGGLDSAEKKKAAGTAEIRSSNGEAAHPQPVENASEQPVDMWKTAPLSYSVQGVVFNCYVFVEQGDSLIVIDKHAAHERIIFEQLKGNMSLQSPPSQRLLLPMEVRLTRKELDTAEQFRTELSKIGFDYSDGKISSYPIALSSEDAAEVFCILVGRLAEGTGDLEADRRSMYEQALYQASCKAAVKAGRQDLYEDIDWIVRQVLSRPEIRYCPHGRPVAVELSKSDFEKKFERK